VADLRHGCRSPARALLRRRQCGSRR
jgi:hypothetical protein